MFQQYTMTTKSGFLYNKAKRMFLKRKCKDQKAMVRPEEEKIMKKWKRRLEKTVFQVMKINMTLISEVGQDTSGREKNTETQTQKGKYKALM